MADSGSFRSSMGGFNKKDVLAYIDAQQARHAEEAAQMQAELERWRQHCETAEAALTEERRSQEALRTAVNTAAEEKQALEKRVELLENAQEDYRRRAAESDDLRRENRRLAEKLEAREQQAQAETAVRLRELTAERDALLAKIRENEASRQNDEDRLRAKLEESCGECEKWKAAGQRYQELIGDVGSFIMEIRAMGQRFLETSYKRSESCLDALDDAVASLERQMADNRSDVEQARQELLENSTSAGLRMEELVQALEEAADKANQEKPASLSDEDKDNAAEFFR